MHRERLKKNVVAILKRHVGRANAISAMDLYCQATGDYEIPARKNNQTRVIRSVVRELRNNRELAILSGNGYWLAASDEELNVFVEKQLDIAKRMFGLASKLSGIPIDRMVEQLKIQLEYEEQSNDEESN